MQKNRGSAHTARHARGCGEACAGACRRWMCAWGRRTALALHLRRWRTPGRSGAYARPCETPSAAPACTCRRERECASPNALRGAWLLHRKRDPLQALAAKRKRSTITATPVLCDITAVQLLRVAQHSATGDSRGQHLDPVAHQRRHNPVLGLIVRHKALGVRSGRHGVIRFYPSQKLGNATTAVPKRLPSGHRDAHDCTNASDNL